MKLFRKYKMSDAAKKEAERIKVKMADKAAKKAEKADAPSTRTSQIARQSYDAGLTDKDLEKFGYRARRR